MGQVVTIGLDKSGGQETENITLQLRGIDCCLAQIGRVPRRLVGLDGRLNSATEVEPKVGNCRPAAKIRTCVRTTICGLRANAVAYIMLHYDRPTDVRNWQDYNGRVKGWIARLLDLPGAVSLMAYRTADGSSPNIIGLLEFRSMEYARSAASSAQAKAVLEELRSVGADAKVLILERSPYTPTPIRSQASPP